jgi:hypothetical protein
MVSELGEVVLVCTLQVLKPRFVLHFSRTSVACAGEVSYPPGLSKKGVIAIHHYQL